MSDELNEQALVEAMVKIDRLLDDPEIAMQKKPTHLVLFPWQLHTFLGWSIKDIADFFECSEQQAEKWVKEVAAGPYAV